MEQAFEKSAKEMRRVKRVKCDGKYVGCGTQSWGLFRVCVIKITTVLEFLVEFSKFLQCTQKAIRLKKRINLDKMFHNTRILF